MKPEDYIEGILKSDRIALSRAITLIESKKKEHRLIADEVIENILPETGKSLRIGITGVPGVGKSTFIEKIGKFLTSNGKKIAVLSIDPTSTISKGSILGDKTRMEELSVDPKAFIRPSPTGNYLGGVAQKTRETILLCEAAGYEIIIVETVGVGQSEVSVKKMVDFFLLLMLAGGGDELQGIKRGIMEMADMIVINKVDGSNKKAGERAAKEFEKALHLFPPNENGWVVPVGTASALEHTGIEDTWKTILKFRDLTTENGHFHSNRENQNLSWFREALRERLEQDFFSRHHVRQNLKETEELIFSGKLPVRKGIDRLLSGI